jgi:hypothetical protein
MPNRVSLQVCEFIDHLEPGVKQHHYGYRIYDDFNQDYANDYTSIADVLLTIGTTPQQILDFVKHHHIEFWGIVVDSQGLLYNDRWINFTEV